MGEKLLPSSPLPPRGAFISSRVIFHPDLTPPLRDTLIQLLALARGGRETPPLTLQQLTLLLGKPRSTLWGHISDLRNHHAALRLLHTAGGTFTIVFSDWTLPTRSPSAASPPESGNPADVKEEELTCLEKKDGFFLSSLKGKFEGENRNLNPRPGVRCAKQKPMRPSLDRPSEEAAGELSPDLMGELRSAGVYPSLFPEIAAAPYTGDELRALLRWAAHDQPENPAPLFIWRLRAEGKAPPAFSAPPCPRCGGYGGKHSDHCPRRYIEGEYADLIEH